MPNVNAARPCRDFRHRMVSTISRAVSSWSYLYGYDLPSIDLESSSCEELLAKSKKLLTSCPSLVEEERMAWQSIKKLLPASCRCLDSSMIRKVATGFRRKPVVLPRGYLRYARRLVSSLFRDGWDQGVYEDHVFTTCPPLSGSTGTKRSEGGVLGSEIDHDSFIQACLYDSDWDLDVSAELTVVQSAGKPRPLSKFSSDTLCLRPLHGAVYDTLSKKKWLCRGDLTSDKLASSGFTRCSGEVLTSGDYKSATDNLSIEVAEVILDELLSKTVSVPNSIKRAAMKILRPNLFSLVENLDFVPSTGQMMGSLLSFPLLCLQNYIAFRYAADAEGLGEVPLLINGDDILFRSSPEFSQRWSDTISSLGLEVERSKTSISASFGSLNSTLIRFRSGRYVVSPTFRFGMLRETEDVTSLSSSYRDFVSGITGAVRFRGGCVWFSWHIAALRQCRLTTLELGFRGSLACRLTRKWGLALAPASYHCPSSVTDHNVLLSSDRCTFVDPSTVSNETRMMSARELASWKFSVSFRRDARRRDAFRYAFALSLVRPATPDFLPYLSGFGERCRLSRPSQRMALSWFTQPVAKKLNTFPLLVPDQRDDVLPSYEAACQDMVWVEVVKDDRK